LTISALLRAVIAIMAGCVVAFLVATAWGSWGRLQAAGRMSVIAEASDGAFKAMHNLRTDRATTAQTLNGDVIMEAATEKSLREYRDAENPAMRSVAELSAAVNFADKSTLLPALTRQIETLKTLQAESWDAMSKPKASRRPALVKEYTETVNALLQTLDKMTTQLTAAVNHLDPVVDQLLAIKQLAWLVRDIPAARPPCSFRRFCHRPAAARSAADLHKIPHRRGVYLECARGVCCGDATADESGRGDGRDEVGLLRSQAFGGSEKLLNAAIAGEALGLTSSEWRVGAVGRLSSAVMLAERALDEAKRYTAAQRSSAQRALILNVTMLIAFLALAIGSMVVVGRRAITPLHTIRDGMLKVAAGDLSVDVGYSERKDEIGALAGALATFKEQAVEKARIEQQEQERNAGARSRQQAIETYIGEFESQVRGTLQQLGDASNQMKATSDGMSDVSKHTNASVQIAAKASARRP